MNIRITVDQDAGLEAQFRGEYTSGVREVAHPTDKDIYETRWEYDGTTTGDIEGVGGEIVVSGVRRRMGRWRLSFDTVEDMDSKSGGWGMNLIPATTAPCGNLTDWSMPDSEPLARIMNSAYVYDSAHVSGAACIYGSARVYGSAYVCGSAYVSDFACVCGSAVISGLAHVSGSAVICGNGHIVKTEDYITVGPIGSEQRSLTLHRDTKLGVRLNRGCFSGGLDEFMSRLSESDEHLAYRKLVPVLHEILRERMTPIEEASDVCRDCQHDDRSERG